MQSRGPWSEPEIHEFLREARIPLRVATQGSAGHPLLASLWFVPEGATLWCATQRSAAIARRLAKDPRCAFEVSLESPPYRGVRGTATATLHPERGEEVLRALIDRYLPGRDTKLARMLLSRVDRETAIAIEPRSLLSWDFTERMEAAT